MDSKLQTQTNEGAGICPSTQAASITATQRHRRMTFTEWLESLEVKADYHYACEAMEECAKLANEERSKELQEEFEAWKRDNERDEDGNLPTKYWTVPPDQRFITHFFKPAS